MRYEKGLLAVLFICLTATVAAAQTAPRTIAFNGVALDANGQPLTGLRGVTLTIYEDQIGSAPLWTEIQAVNVDAAGRYSVYLGAMSPEGLPMELFVNAQARWLDVQLEGQDVQPRVFLASVPYALKAADAETVGGLPVTSFVLVNDPMSSASRAGTSSIATVPSQDSDEPTRDQVILDDLIVDGSACIGFDCVNGESFGFDTLRLKENNLRIHAVDTSSSSSFPSNDWQITFNDSSNGGQNKFSIDDIDGGRTPFTLEAGAPSHSLYVDDGGRIGLGTSTPVVQVHVKDGNTPTMRLEQDGSSGFTPQTWDVAGNEANFFVRDATNGSTLPFRIFPGAPSNALTIAASTGDVGIGVASPQATLHMGKSGGNPTELRMIGNEGLTSARLFDGGTDDPAYLHLYYQDATVISIGAFDTYFNAGNVGILNTAPAFPLQVGTDNSNGNGAHVTTGGVWTNGSSRQFKERIHPLTRKEALETLAGLDPMTYYYKAEPGELYAGFIAEDVPGLVATGDRKGLAAMDIVAVLTRVVKEQQKAIEDLSTRLVEVENAAFRSRATLVLLRSLYPTF